MLKQRRSRWLGALVALAGTAMALGTAAPAAAEGPSVGVPRAVKGGGAMLMLNDKPMAQSMLKLEIRGERQTAYCIDFHTQVALDKKYAEGTWGESEVNNLGKVQWVLTHGHPNAKPAQLLTAAGVQLPENVRDGGVSRLLYFGTQTAIWHFSDGVRLGDHVAGKRLLPPAQYAVVKKVHDYLVANATDQPEPKTVLTIAPERRTGLAGEKVGPYTVSGPAGAIALDVEGGKAIDADGKALTETRNGDTFWLTRDSAGEVSVTATGKGSVSFGRVFLYKGDKPAQKLILGDSIGESLTAKAGATYTAPGGGGMLPVTGTTSVALMAGLVLLTAGAGTVLVMRRRRTRFIA